MGPAAEAPLSRLRSSGFCHRFTVLLRRFVEAFIVRLPIGQQRINQVQVEIGLHITITVANNIV